MKSDRKDLVYWIPRVLTIIFLVFLALFSLDIFEGNYGFWGTIVGLFMHNIPVMILAVVLAIAWKWEIVGGAVFILAGLGYLALAIRTAVMHPLDRMVFSGVFLITVPALVVGVLFLIGWYKKR